MGLSESYKKYEEMLRDGMLGMHKVARAEWAEHLYSVYKRPEHLTAEDAQNATFDCLVETLPSHMNVLALRKTTSDMTVMSMIRRIRFEAAVELYEVAAARNWRSLARYLREHAENFKERE